MTAGVFLLDCERKNNSGSFKTLPFWIPLKTLFFSRKKRARGEIKAGGREEKKQGGEIK